MEIEQILKYPYIYCGDGPGFWDRWYAPEHLSAERGARKPSPLCNFDTCERVARGRGARKYVQWQGAGQGDGRDTDGVCE